MLDELKAHIEKEKLLDPEDRILVGASGGVDSMVLLVALLRLKYHIEVAHMNFQLRGKDSEKDEQLVLEWATQNGVRIHVNKKRLNTAGESVQMAAREARYEWFEELLQTKDLDKVALAHHLNDSFETVLLNLTRGTGLAGLKGIASKRGPFVRPLMCFSKEQILDFAKSEGISWREDLSNQKNDYQRNLIRNEVIPKLMGINPSLIATYARTRKRISATEALIEHQVNDLGKLVSRGQNETVVSLDWTKGDDTDIEVLVRILEPFKASFQVCDQILGSTESGKIFHTERHTICLDRYRLIITEKSFSEVEQIQLKVPGVYHWQDTLLKISKEENNRKVIKDSSIAMLDAAKLTWPITVRKWEEGDDFQPLGMTGKKKVSDFMIDLKIPLTLKEDIPIFLSGDRIVWVGGFRIDERFKVTADTREIVRIELLKNG